MKYSGSHLLTYLDYSRQHKNNLKVLRTTCEAWGCFCHQIFPSANRAEVNFCISCQMKKFFLSHTIFRKYFLITGRNILALKIIYCHRNKFLVTERNLLLRAEVSCHRTKFLLAERHFLSMNEISC